MATKRALSHLDALIKLAERADRQITSLAIALTSVIEQMDAITSDADLNVAEVLVEETTGEETEFRVSRTPVKAGSLTLYFDDQAVGAANYDLDLGTGVMTPAGVVPVGKKARVEYTVLGLASQTVQLLNVIPELDAAWFTARKAQYQTAINWIESNQ